MSLCAYCEEPIEDGQPWAIVYRDDEGIEHRAHAATTDAQKPSHAILALWEHYEMPHDPEHTMGLTQREAEPIMHLLNAINHSETVGPNSIVFFQFRDPVAREELWQRLRDFLNT